MIIAVIVRRRRVERSDSPSTLSAEERQRLAQLLDKDRE
ncbi:Cytochrome c heme lyase subunit CcmL [Pseudomonas chlororaphis subsp. aurantiaca]|nr:Cytochrome c heme lyase subunit CcmL [Pseudomonas chlororaphis subsp. aurantiaca]